MRDWISQATAEQLADLDRLIGEDPSPHSSEGTPRWTVRRLGEVAAFFGVQLQTVKEWRSGPDRMPGEEGAWRLDEIARWRVAKAQYTGRDPSARSALEKEKLEINVSRDRLRLRQEGGELVSRDAAKAAVQQMFHRVRGQIEPLPEQLASSVPAAARPDYLLVARERVHLVLTEMSNWQFEREVDPDPPSAPETA